jgi:uncharacterized membrane protein
MAAMRTERGLDRLVNFSDATVAIAITILILPLADEGPEAVREGLGTFFDSHMWQVVAFVVSFVVIARFWMVHHQVLEQITTYTTSLMWLNVLWLASIVVIPFTASVLSDAPGRQSAVYGLYIGNMLVTSLAMQAMEVLIARSPTLRGSELEAVVAATPAVAGPAADTGASAVGGDTDATGRSAQPIDTLHGWSSVILMALAGVLAVLFPSVGPFWLLLLLLSTPVYRALAFFARR